MSDLVRLMVNADTCIGSGMCEMLEEEHFLIDDDTNIATVIGDGQLPADRAAKVIDQCPASAISALLPEPDDG